MVGSSAITWEFKEGKGRAEPKRRMMARAMMTSKVRIGKQR
jgi:hypothetical protein